MYDKLPIIPTKKHYKTVKGRDFYVRLFEYRDYRNYALVFFNSKKINVYTLKKRLFDKLVYYGLTKSLTKKFCSSIIPEIKYELKKYLHKIPNRASKKNHLFKEESKFSITSSGNRLFNSFVGDIKKLKNCNILDLKSIENLFKLRELKLDSNYRIHEYRWVFSSLDVEILDVIKHIIKFGVIRDKNLTIWSNKNNTTQKATSIIISISSRTDKEICNLELLNKGFEQIAKRLPIELTLLLFMKMRMSKVSVELGVKILEGFENFKPYPFTYKVYKMRYWVDSSYKGRELDFRFETNLNAVSKSIKLIEQFKTYVSLYEKGILTIEPFSLENTLRSNTTNDFTKKAKGSSKVIVFLKRVILRFTFRKIKFNWLALASLNKVNFILKS